MDDSTLKALISQLKSRDEVEYIEVKHNFGDVQKIGETLSALSNSASYYEQEYGYLIWGIENDTWDIKGTSFNLRNKRYKKQDAWLWILGQTNREMYIEDFEFELNGHRVYVVRVKNCGNQPVNFSGIPYIRINSHNQPLLKFRKHHQYILNKNTFDWSAQVVEEVGEDLTVLDESAIEFLRSKLAEAKNDDSFLSDRLERVLSRVGLLSDGRINRSCLLMLGKSEITSQYLPDVNKITWVYRDKENDIEERIDLDVAQMPMILLLPEIKKQINRFNTFLKDRDLFRQDIRQYDDKAVEEILVNAIAHRDWTIPLWVEVVQTPTSLEVRNPGVFRADWDSVLLHNTKPPYLNKNLVTFLNHIKLMEREADGLRKAYEAQARKGLRIERRAPENKRVDIILKGKVEYVEFAQLMLNHPDFSLEEVVVFEKIISGRNTLGVDITDEEYQIVEKYVKKTPRGGKLKIRREILEISGHYEKEFSTTHTTGATMEQIILDYAKQHRIQFSTHQIYQVMSGKDQSVVRNVLSSMVKKGVLRRLEKGVYIISKEGDN